MSDNTLLSRYAGRSGEEGDRDPRPELSPWDDLGCFGWLRGIRDRATMLELRKKNGNILAVGYGWLEKVEFDPSEGITLHLVGQKVLIAGRNLNKDVRPLMRLFEGITRHRVPWIAEASRAQSLEAAEDACVIESIEW